MKKIIIKNKLDEVTQVVETDDPAAWLELAKASEAWSHVGDYTIEDGSYSEPQDGIEDAVFWEKTKGVEDAVHNA